MRCDTSPINAYQSKSMSGWPSTSLPLSGKAISKQCISDPGTVYCIRSLDLRTYQWTLFNSADLDVVYCVEGLLLANIAAWTSTIEAPDLF
jgi:hypothetical protein